MQLVPLLHGMGIGLPPYLWTVVGLLHKLSAVVTHGA
jgi:hypothetical protein